MLQATVLGSGIFPGQVIHARARVRDALPPIAPGQHLVQPLSLFPTTPSSASSSSNAYPTPSTSASPLDTGDEALSWLGNEVTWSRGAELVRRFSYAQGLDKADVVCAAFAWFNDTPKGKERDKDTHSSGITASIVDGPAGTPSNTFGPFHMSQYGKWRARPDVTTRDDSNGHLRRSVVVILPKQADIYLATGEHFRVHIPFRVDACWPLPTGGLLIQRALQPRELRARKRGPRPSALDRTSMSALEGDLDEDFVAPLPMLYTLTRRCGELQPVIETSLTGGIRDTPTIVPGTPPSFIPTSQTVLYVAPDPYPFLVVYDRDTRKVIFYRRAIVPLVDDEPPPATERKTLSPQELLRQAGPPAGGPRRGGRTSMARPSDRRVSAAPDPFDRARRRTSRLSTASFPDEDFEAPAFPMEKQSSGDPRRLSSRRMSAVATKREAEYQFPRTALGMLAEDLRETTMLQGLNQDATLRSDLVLDRLWEWRPPGSIDVAATRVFLSENQSPDSVFLNLVLTFEHHATTLFTFHIEAASSPSKFVFHELRATKCLGAAPIIATRTSVLETIVATPDGLYLLSASGRKTPIEVNRVSTVDGRDEVARQLAFSLSMTLDGNGNSSRGGIVDIVDANGSRVTVVYSDGERVRVSLDFTLPQGLVRRSMEALSYALSPLEYEELTEACIAKLQSIPHWKRLEPGELWRVFAEVLCVKCGLPSSPVPDMREDMLSSWATQSDPVLRRLALRVRSSRAQAGMQPPVNPAPSTPRILLAMHLIAQDCRLACTTEADLSLLAPMILRLASAIGRADWVDYWRRLMPSSLARATLAPPSGEVDSSLLDAHEEPPDILDYLARTLVCPTRRFPSPKDVSMRPSPLGMPMPCLQTELLAGIYSRMTPTGAERTVPPGQSSNATGRALAVVTYIVERGLGQPWIANLPFGVGTPILEMIRLCQTNPPKDVPEAVYVFIGRPDLAANCRFDRSTLDLPVGAEESPEEVPTVGQILNVDGTAKSHNHSVALPHVRFGTDRRLEEIDRIMQTGHQRTIAIEQPKGANEQETLAFYQQVVTTIASRTLATTVGQGMFNYGSRTAPIVDLWQTPRIELNVRVLPVNSVYNAGVNQSDCDWPCFHSGVSSALKISPECEGITASWIAFNRPNPLSADHAGFLLGLGLQGHLRLIDSAAAFQYLEPRHDLTTIGLLLGLGASYAGSQDTVVTRTMSLHTAALLPFGSMDLNQSTLVQSTALVSIGLVYAGSRYLRMAEITLREISRASMPGVDSFNEYREAYNFSAAMAFGLIMLGRGGQLSSEVERRMVQQLTLCIHGNTPDINAINGNGKRVEMPAIDTTLTGPGATLALGFMFLKSGQRDIASILSVPQTALDLESVRPEHLLMRTFARALILWDDVMPTADWFDEQLPPFLRGQKRSMELNSEVAFVNIVAGACLGLAFRYAGAANEAIHELITTKFGMLGKMAAVQSMSYEGKIRRNAARQALNIVSLAAAIQMAGTGELGLTRRLRVSHGQEGAGINYGSHMAMHMALGILYLGRGYYILGNSNLAIASLAIACFPRFLPSYTENKAYPQAFRHLWALAVEPRCIIARDVDTRESVFLPITVHTKGSSKGSQLISPTPVPPLDTLKSIVIDSPRYLSLSFDFTNPRDWDIIVQTRTVWVKRRAGFIDYATDPRGYRSLMVRAGTMSGFDLHYDLISPAAPLTVPSHEVIELVTTHSTNPVCVAIARRFSGETWFERFARNVLFECLSIDKIMVLGLYLSMALGLQAKDDLVLERITQAAFVQKFYSPAVWDRYFGAGDGTKRKPILRQTFLQAMGRTLAASEAPQSRFGYFGGEAPLDDTALSVYLARNAVPPVRLLDSLRSLVVGASDSREVLELKARHVAQRYSAAVTGQYDVAEGAAQGELWKLASLKEALDVWLS